MTQKVKDFQSATADRILHIFKDLGHRRVLLADEVELGKTFVARQVISLVRQWHKEELHDDFFRVVYICSNANIADQNIEKLGVKNPMNISESRLSMQHLYLWEADNENSANTESGEMPETIIPLTPSTSFRFYSSQGMANERALMYVILQNLEIFKPYNKELSDFFSCGVKSWQYLIDAYSERVGKCGEEYLSYITSKIESKLDDEQTNKLIDYATNGCVYQQRAELINYLRQKFAEISIEKLDPDLVIMDEFQRFNSLLEDGDDEQSMLTKTFFDDNRKNTKILLLSATPYKPYSTLEELNEKQCDEQYQDFMKVMDFLFVSKDINEYFHLTWQRYSAALKRSEVTDLTPLIDAKTEAESMLYGTMCRTERFNSGIIDDSNVTDVSVMPEDIISFAQGQNLMDCLSDENGNLGNLPIEYIKSAPYLLSFMDKYELKKSIVKALKRTNITREYKKENTLLLKKYAINNYRPISQGNGKLIYLHDLVFGERREKKAHLLLWVPASNPYYKAGGLFESEEARKFSKILLFSSWEMVPRMISVMMSYYSELYTFGEIKYKRNDLKLQYFSKKNRYGENRLRSDGLLEYPCRTLASLFNPKEYYGARLSAIKNDIKAKISRLLTENEVTGRLPKQRRSNAKYILALMMLLDNEQIEDYDGLYIPDNAIDVLTDIAIASPAVCAYRQSHDVEDAKIAAKAIVSVFNKPESAAVIDLLYSKHSEDDYYESVLDYCVNGNLQSVLDEYSHMLQAESIGCDLDEAIIGTSNLSIDTFDSLGSEEKKLPMRCHFAIPFIDKTVTDKSVARTKNIRKAFNSPFRPFILSTTSIGQEGLDFHWYSRKIVHWNLPSNPVDLEQREGRINRFECLALRRNVANLFRSEQYMTWDEMFKSARDKLKGEHSDIVPYWCLPINELKEEQRKHLQYIERIVPLFPLSRDRYRYERLIKVLALYRMTMGQPRQEELLDLLSNMNLTDEQIRTLTIDLCPFDRLLNTEKR